MKKFITSATLFFSLITVKVNSQSLSINTDGSTANASAMLDVKSTVKGLLIPRMTSAQRTTIASPATGLQVYDTDVNLIYFYNGATWAGLSASTNFWTFSGGHIYNNTGTNVGIGITAPAEKLEINGNLKFTAASTIYSNTGTALALRPGDGTGTGGALNIRGGNAGPGSGGAGGDLNLIGGANMPLGGSGYGNLGPSGNINLTAGSGYNTAGGNINMQAGATSCWAQTGGAHSDVSISGGQTNYSINDPASIVYEGGKTNGGCSGNSNGGNLILKAGIGAGAGSIGNIQLLNGNVGIGCTTPAYKLHVIGDVASSGTFRSANAVVTGAISACSDARFKTNITSLANPIKKLMQLQGVNYYWKMSEYKDMNFSNKMQIGFIAQDVEKLFPEMVFTDDAGYKSIDYSRLTPVLVETIKEQQKQINDIAARLKEMEKQLIK